MNLNENDPEIEAALILLDAQIEAERKDQKIPGLSAAVIYDQEIIWFKGFGYANVQEQIPAHSRTAYRIGSITKLFTATMLMQLRDAGKLQLDDPIEKYVPAFKLKSPFDDQRPPTFRQVVSHTAGLPIEAPLDYWQTLEFPTIEKVLESLKDAEMVFPAMTKFKYSNLGFAILGYALEVIANQPFKEYIVEHILRPLGMDNSGFNVSEDLKRHMAVGYSPAKDDQPHKVAPHPDIGALAPAGQLYSSVEDLARFISLQFQDSSAGGNKILGGSTLREMHAPAFMMPDWRVGIGIAWALSRMSNHTVIFHEGHFHGYSANIALVPDMKLGMAVLTNTIADPASITKAAFKVLIPVVTRVLARQAGAREIGKTISLEKYLGHYTRPDFGEIEVKASGGKLQVFSLDRPAAYRVILEPQGEHKFRIQGGHVSGELAIFELNEAGDVTRLKLGIYPFERVEFVK